MMTIIQLQHANDNDKMLGSFANAKGVRYRENPEGQLCRCYLMKRMVMPARHQRQCWCSASMNTVVVQCIDSNKVVVEIH